MQQQSATTADKPKTLIHEKLVTFDEDRASGDLIIKHTQEIPDDFLSTLRANKIDTDHKPMDDLYLVATVPVAIVEELQRRYNFDVMREPVRETMKMLRKLHLDLFIQTNKRI